MTLKEIKIILDRYKSLYKAALNDNAEVSQVNFIEVYDALEECFETLDIIREHGDFAIIKG
jgi:hypothetical protein